MNKRISLKCGYLVHVCDSGLVFILTFLVSLRLISQRSNRRSSSFLAAGRKNTFHEEEETLQAVSCFTRDAVTGSFNHGELRTKRCFV